MLIYFAKYQLSANSLARNENCIAMRCGEFHFSFRVNKRKRVARFPEELKGGWREGIIEVRLIYYNYRELRVICGLGLGNSLDERL